jgi:hypothetical protein
MSEQLPIPHIASEFYVWLWWASEQQESRFELAELGRIEVWVDERLAFRSPNPSEKVSAVMTGMNPSAFLESRAALAGGKVLQDVRVAIRRDDREFAVTLKGPAMEFQGVKLPQAVSGDEAIYDRMFLYEELAFLVAGLFRQFSEDRTSARWQAQLLPAIAAWVQGD